MSIRVLGLMGFLLCCTQVYAAEETGSRPLTQTEKVDFLKLVCNKPHIKKGETICATMHAYPPSADAPDLAKNASLDLTAVLYGAFTKPNAHEAYVTYRSSAEGPATNSGGGILFEQTGAQWQFVRWFVGNTMDSCVLVPGTMPNSVLCLKGGTGQGITESNVGVEKITGKEDASAQDVYYAVDEQGTGQPFSACDKLEAKKGYPLSVEDLKPETKDGAFAKSTLTYALPGEMEKSCKSGNQDDIKTGKAELLYRMKGDSVTVTPSVALTVVPPPPAQ